MNGPQWAGQWTFFQDPCEEWRWVVLDESGNGIAAAVQGFRTEVECALDARRHGWPGHSSPGSASGVSVLARSGTPRGASEEDGRVRSAASWMAKLTATRLRRRGRATALSAEERRSLREAYTRMLREARRSPGTGTS